MKRQVVLAAVWPGASVLLAAPREPADWVDPTIGATSHMLVPAHPTVSVPFGMYRFAPPGAWFTVDEMTEPPLFLPSHRAAGLFALRFPGGKFTFDDKSVSPYAFAARVDSHGFAIRLVPSAKGARKGRFNRNPFKPDTCFFHPKDRHGGPEKFGANLDRPHRTVRRRQRTGIPHSVSLQFRGRAAQDAEADPPGAGGVVPGGRDGTSGRRGRWRHERVRRLFHAGLLSGHAGPARIPARVARFHAGGDRPRQRADVHRFCARRVALGFGADAEFFEMTAKPAFRGGLDITPSE